MTKLRGNEIGKKSTAIMFKINLSVRFQILTAASMKMTASWDAASCSLAEVYSPDDGGRKHLWNISKLLLDYTAQQPRGQPSSINSFITGV
jgi:hypothetical protein